MKYIQLVASDIDGTLLLNGAKTLDPEIFKLIRELHKKAYYSWQLLVESIQICAIYSYL